MDTSKNQANSSSTDMSILHSETVKARQRIYYIDVKRDRNGDYYLSLTESKKLSGPSSDNSQTAFEKHKLFLYSEDMKRFSKALAKAIDYIHLHEKEELPVAPTWEGPFSADELSEQSSLSNTSPDVEPSADNYHPNVDFWTANGLAMKKMRLQNVATKKKWYICSHIPRARLDLTAGRSGM